MDLKTLEFCFDSLNQGMLITDGEGKEVYANPAFREIFPDTRKIFRELIKEDSNPFKFDQEILETQTGKEEKTVGIRAEKVQWQGSDFFKIQTLDSSLTACFEILEKEKEKRKQYEEILIQQSKLATLGEMTGMIAHQWRQPLNAFGLLVQDIEQAYLKGRLDREYLKKNVKKAMDQVLFMSRTMDDFRDFFKPGKKKDIFDIRKAVKDVLFLMEGQLKKHGISLELQEKNPVQGPNDYCVSGYSNQFRHVVLNLLQNAYEALVSAKKKNQALSGEIVIIFFSAHGKTGFRIQDNGGGIPKEAFNRIFEPYFTTKSQDQGTGIGLYLARIIIEERMGGRITVENTGQGARFSVELMQGEKSWNSRKS